MRFDLNHEIVPINQLVPNPKNPRVDLRPGMPIYQKLKESLIHHDYVEPIIWNKRTGYIVSGHQRLQVMKDIAEEDGEILDALDVIVVDMPENRADTLMVAINKITGIWDEDKLKTLFQELNESDYTYTGYEDFEIDKLLNEDTSVPDDVQDSDTISTLDDMDDAKTKDAFKLTIIFDTEDERESAYYNLKDKGYNVKR